MSAKILIVEDRPEIQTLIRMTLEFEGHDLHTADNGGDGWRLAQTLRPDLVLLDIMMPGELDGLQVCERIRATPALAATRVVLLTARGQQSDRAAGAAVGCDAYLTKPFSPLELIETVESMLSTPAGAPAR
jgi:DNA-binding response OmpR family regulator